MAKHKTDPSFELSKANEAIEAWIEKDSHLDFPLSATQELERLVELVELAETAQSWAFQIVQAEAKDIEKRHKAEIRALELKHASELSVTRAVLAEAMPMSQDP